MTGPAPKKSRARRNPPARGEWKASEGVGWQHGKIPELPAALGPMTQLAWQMWMQSWIAAHWRPKDLPGLLVVAGLYHKVVDDGAVSYASELRVQMDTYGLTPKGQQDRRWLEPGEPETAAAKKKAKGAKPETYRGLRAVE
jgi:hypothetical protein